ncbi:MAG: RlmE family RNA methyltransferase [Alphaproteobacteria bacterium]|nr:RlmE family RNA methyltransferase [Alphaproteobacteria bacterium]
MKKTSTANPRGYHVDLKNARGRSSSSQRWLRWQLNDPFVRKAQAEGYRSRAAYKLFEIEEKFHLFRPGMNVLDIGCAPGGWLQVIQQCTRNHQHRGRIIGIDILATESVTGVTIFQGDVRKKIEQRRIWETCDGMVDVVLSDMAAPMIGHAKTDQMNVTMLAETAWDIAEVVLAQGGHFACKVFAGGTEQSLLQRLKAHFKRVKHCKPVSSRKGSREMYLVATERKTTPTLTV